MPDAAPRRVPALALLFVGLVLIDIGIRGSGLFGLALYLDLAHPLGVVTTFLPHDLVIALPALLVVRRPGLRHDAPRVWLGTVVVAATEFLLLPAWGLASADVIDPISTPPLVATGAMLGTAIGWAILGRGLLSLERGRVSWWAGALGILAAAAVTIGSINNIGVFFATDGGFGVVAELYAVELMLSAIALGYLARSVVRAAADGTRSRPARWLGALAVLLLVSHTVIVFQGGFTSFGGLQLSIAFGPFSAGTSAVLGWLTDQVAISLLAAAFVAGIADTWDAPSEPESPMSALAERVRARRTA